MCLCVCVYPQISPPKKPNPRGLTRSRSARRPEDKRERKKRCNFSLPPHLLLPHRLPHEGRGLGMDGGGGGGGGGGREDGTEEEKERAMHVHVKKKNTIRIKNPKQDTSYFFVQRAGSASVYVCYTVWEEKRVGVWVRGEGWGVGAG